MARPKIQLNRRQDIIDAAQIIFTHKGYEKTAIEDIAKFIGISKASIYIDFKNKEDILKAVIERSAILLLADMGEQLKNAKEPYLEDLRQILHKSILLIFDMSTAHVRTYITQLLTCYKHKFENEFVIQKWYDNIQCLLELAAKNNEISPFNDYRRLSQLVSVGLQGFMPPYDLKYSIEHRTDLSKDEVKSILSKDVSIILEIIISGLKNAKY
jgi:AcrR family transcriptional regulator